MTDLREMTVADMAEATAYVAARFGATVTYDCPVWTIWAVSGKKHEGFSLMEAVTWHTLREPPAIPQCCHCDSPFTHADPWRYEGGAYFHEGCYRDAQEWPYSEREYAEAVGHKHPDQR